MSVSVDRRKFSRLFQSIKIRDSIRSVNDTHSHQELVEIELERRALLKAVKQFSTLNILFGHFSGTVRLYCNLIYIMIFILNNLGTFRGFLFVNGYVAKLCRLCNLSVAYTIRDIRSAYAQSDHHQLCGSIYFFLHNFLCQPNVFKVRSNIKQL